jgi:BirA family transcriptional regulator, biotin operon repressor / biotin---[acetyl-CoA-carboxylase] ligase
VVPTEEARKAAGLNLADFQEALKALEERGCRVERSPGGVELTETSIACWRDVLEDRARRKGRVSGRRTLVFSRTTSTNDVAWEQTGSTEANGLVVLADEQTAGRGRPGHVWSARAGESVLMSLAVAGVAANELNRMTLLAGLSTARAVERVTGLVHLGAEIKWPNDVLVRGKKIAGILVERRAATDERAPVVIGVGLNVLQDPENFPGELRERATSVRAAAGLAVDRLDVVVALVDELSVLCTDLEGVSGGWIEEWKRRCTLLGKLVTVRSEGRVVTGHVVDISPLQGLTVKDSGGAVHFLSAVTSSLL